jgi:signal transduction histidine kinase/CheY-like chemotaxis protein
MQPDKHAQMTETTPGKRNEEIPHPADEKSALPSDADPKLVAKISAIGIVCTLLLAIHAAITGRYVIGSTIVVVAITIAINLFLAARRPISYLQLNISVAIITVAITVAILIAGTPTASAVVLLPLIPFVMGALGNRRLMIVWLGIVLLLLIALFFHAPYATSHYVEPAADQVALHYLHVLVLGFIITITGYVLMGKRHDFLLELESARARLTLARDEARRANDVKGEFLGRMSHELRTPLNAILGFAEVMGADDEAPLTSAQIQRLSHIQVSGHRLLEIVDQILEITTHDTRRRFMVLLPTPVAAAIGAAVNASSAIAARMGVSISVDASSFQTIHVLSEHKALVQLLSEFIDNAVRFNRQGGSVDIRVAEDSGYAKIIITDTGIGLPEAAIDEMFEPFSQQHPRERERIGAGLGLTTARALADSMNATISVQSKLDVGSTFTLALPLYLAPASAQSEAIGANAEAATIKQDKPQPDKPFTQPVVLYIEDNQLNQLVMRAMFDELECGALHIAETGTDGLQMAQTLAPNLLLIDIHLPDCTGIELLARIRACPALKLIPAIAVSADATPEHITAALATGFDDYLVKPVSLQTLNDALDRQLRKSRQR